MKLWISRDCDGELWAFDHKPIKEGGLFMSNFELDGCCASELPACVLPEVTFENSPMQVELKLIKEE